MSMPGSPSTIHSASCQPAPPAAVMPKLWPSLSHTFGKPQAGPMSALPSGVYEIGPLTMSLMPQFASAGTRRCAPSTYGTSRSRSPSKRLLPNQDGTPSANRAGAPASYGPRIQPMRSSRR